MISRESSPPPLSDDSAVSSLASSNSNGQAAGPAAATKKPTNSIANATANKTQVPPSSPRPSDRSQTKSVQTAEQPLVSKSELISAANRMRYNNTTLTSRSIRTHLSCFDNLDIKRYEMRTDYLVNFISIGVNRCPSFLQRPVSILWPDTYDKMIDGLAELDAHLINTEFLEKPINWMLKRGLTSVPTCRQCKDDMLLKYDNDTVRWQCQKTQVCLSRVAPLQRPSFFREFENIGLIRILFSIYFWSACTQMDIVSNRLKIDRQILYGIWKSLQNVCRTAMDRLPKLQLSNTPDNQPELKASIDLISIKFNGTFIVCGKHPQSNKIRLGLCIPGVSRYTPSLLALSWFQPNSVIRVCESKFLELMEIRDDLKVELVTRSEMVSKDGKFDRDSAFGYLICQLTHTFKDVDSSSISTESLKLILEELQWREMYGTTPMKSFTNIINHIAKFELTTDSYTEPTNEISTELMEFDARPVGSEFFYAEKYFYASVEPIDGRGEPIRNFGKPENLEEPPVSLARFFCHICSNAYESFYFSMHMIEHVEANRKEDEDKNITKRRLIECKHCFKPHKREDIAMHSALLRSHTQSIKFGCRICCIKFKDRASYLQHMRRNHFEHETPYRCPACKYATSFQRELFIHFQEEHRTSFILLCPFCLRSFTVARPENLNLDEMRKISTLIYNHFLEHYVVANSYSCSNCSLSFLNKANLKRHKVRHHNPLEIHPEKQVRMQPFIVSREEEPYCVQAFQLELFISNKRPNLAFNEAQSSSICSAIGDVGPSARLKTTPEMPGDERPRRSDDSSESSSSDEDDYLTANEEESILHVRNPNEATKFLAGGKPALRIPKYKISNAPLTSEKILEFMSQMRRADGIAANQSVILTPTGRPALCVECKRLVATDHYVAAITCRKCKYTTHCPAAATQHQVERHKSAPLGEDGDEELEEDAEEDEDAANEPSD